MMRRFLPALTLCLLSACATPEQIAAARQQQEQMDAETCASYGLKPGGENFGMCLFQLDLARQQRYYYDRPTFHYGVGAHHYLHHHY